MLREMMTIALTTLVSLIVCQPSRADEQCLPVLRPDVVDLSTQIEKNLVLLEKRLQEDSSQNSGAAVASYGGFSFNGEQARQARSSLSTLLELNYSESEKDNVYLSTLSDNAVKAYIACITAQRDPISHNFVGDILNRDAFFLQINWHPDYRPEGDNQTLIVKVTQGKVLESNSITYTAQIKPTDSALVTIVRDPFEPTQIAAIVDGRVEIVDVPARARYKILQSEVVGPEKVMATVETSGDVGWDSCVSLDSNDFDRAIIPGSFQFVFSRLQTQGVTQVLNNPVRESSRSACKYLGLVFQTVFHSYAYVNMAPKVQVFFRQDQRPLTTQDTGQNAISLNTELPKD